MKNFALNFLTIFEKIKFLKFFRNFLKFLSFFHHFWNFCMWIFDFLKISIKIFESWNYYRSPCYNILWKFCMLSWNHRFEFFEKSEKTWKFVIFWKNFLKKVKKVKNRYFLVNFLEPAQSWQFCKIFEKFKNRKIRKIGFFES